MLVVYAAEVEARGSTRVVAVTREEYQRAVAQLLQRHQSNFALHGRRMASTFFRMIFF